MTSVANSLERVEEPGANNFNVKPSKRLLRKFYTLLSIEYLVLTAVLSSFVFPQHFRENVSTDNFINKVLLFGSIIVNMMCLLHSLTISNPYGYIVLQIMAVCVGIIVGMVTIKLNVLIIYLAFIETIFFVVIFTVLAFFKIVDSNLYHLYIIINGVLGLAIFLFAMLFLFFFPSEEFARIAVVVDSVVFIMYVCSNFLYNTQIILDGKRPVVTHHNRVSAVGPFLISFGLWVIFFSQCHQALWQL